MSFMFEGGFLLDMTFVLLIVCAFAVALCDRAAAGESDYLVSDEFDAQAYEDLLALQIEIPRCRCGRVLRLEDWRVDSCEWCQARTRIVRRARGDG